MAPGKQYFECMRAKVVLSASVLALLILAPVIYFHFAPGSPPPDQSAPAPEQAAIAPQVGAAPALPHPRRTPGPANGGEGVPAPDAAADPTAANHEEYVGGRQAELTQLGVSDDPSDLKTILSELNNKDSRIRQSALSAAVQFGSKDAIPTLQNEIAWTDDPQEKVDLMNAIKYLQLPSFQDQANLARAASQPSSDQTPPTN
jgi:hypothetical protein